MSLPTVDITAARRGDASLCDCAHRVDQHGAVIGSRLDEGCWLCECPMATSSETLAGLMAPMPSSAPESDESEPEPAPRPVGRIPKMKPVNRPA